jgi:D-beta-D-heptose 7-phosphate kinase/D-beta-D-heptose 1-phosphate adenosyltransferase
VKSESLSMNTSKQLSLKELISQVSKWKSQGEKIVFTNGCFDVFHAGHAYILNTAKTFGTKLIVGLNSDASVTNLKGTSRPINKEQNRVYVLSSLEVVDAVVAFEDATPLELIKAIQPDVLVKGGDYVAENIVGAKEVLEAGGKVEIVPLVDGLSSSKIIEGLKK